MRRSLRKAPAPLEAVNSSLRLGSKTTACSTTPRRARAMEIAYWGKPWMKLVVPSSGSMIHWYSVSASGPVSPDSSAKMLWLG